MGRPGSALFNGSVWDEVWVVGAQEGVWPDLRARGSTLRAEELTREGIGSGPRPADLLEEERRLFYVACTRGRRQVHVAVVDEQDDGGDLPSRFVSDLLAGLAAVGGPERITAVRGRPRHPVTLDGLVAELRAVAQDPRATPTLREAAIARLAVLAAQRDDLGEPLVPLADPRQWWGLREPTVGVRPVRDPDRPIHLSGSGLVQALAQVVYTATELDGVRSVEIKVDGETQAWPTADLDTTSEPLTIYDYPGMVRSAQPDYPSLPSGS